MKHIPNEQYKRQQEFNDVSYITQNFRQEALAVGSSWLIILLKIAKKITPLTFFSMVTITMATKQKRMSQFYFSFAPNIYYDTSALAFYSLNENQLTTLFLLRKISSQSFICIQKHGSNNSQPETNLYWCTMSCNAHFTVLLKLTEFKTHPKTIGVYGLVWT